MTGPADRIELARARRRQEALDSVAFERTREEALVQRLAPLVRDAEAWRVDADALARMQADEGEFLRRIKFVQPRPAEDALERLESKIAGLEAQLDDCRRRQRAFQAYADALGTDESS